MVTAVINSNLAVYVAFAYSVLPFTRLWVAMAWSRNLLISIGAFWISRQPVVLFAWLVGKVNTGIMYGDSFVAALGLGVMNGMGRAICAGLGAAVVAFWATGRRPHRWALVVALLYAVAARPHYHYVRPTTNWDRISQTADVLWPAVVCLLVAAVIGWKRCANPSSEDSAVTIS